MWLMLQQDEPRDYVIGTGKAHSVRELCEVAFAHVGLGYRDHVVVDQAHLRPAEVDHLLADSARARNDLGWQPQVDFAALVRLMVDADIERHSAELAR
jgi:GDPmannose 4,6-dehydratase